MPCGIEYVGSPPAPPLAPQDKRIRIPGHSPQLTTDSQGLLRLIRRQHVVDLKLDETLERGCRLLVLAKFLVALHKLAGSVHFGGRLGEYKYYDMHQIVGAALSLCNKLLGEAR